MSTHKPYYATPKHRNRVTATDIVAAVLCFVVPPVGVVLVWGKHAFGTVARIALTVCSVAVLTFLFGRMMPAKGISGQTVTPVPVSAQRVMAEDTSDVIHSLSNMDALLKSQQSTQADASTPVSSEIASAEAMAAEAEKQAILSTHVYTVYSANTKYYHKAPKCDKQSNRRELTLAEALAEKLAACPNCNPVVYTKLDTEKILGEQ